MLYQIALPYACFEVEVENEIVVNIAPIWKFCIGWQIDRLKSYVKKKGGKIELILSTT